MKSPKTYEEQIEKLQEHGVVVDDKKALLQFLSQVNYYRFTAFLLPFKDQKEISSTKLMHIYNFDKYIKLWIYDNICEIECYWRTQIAYHLAHYHGADSHMTEDIYKDSHSFNHSLLEFEKIKKKNQKTLIVKHHNRKYDGRFPIWVIIELFTFTNLSTFYSNLSISIRKKIANKTVDSPPEDKISSWLKCATELRNKVAHYNPVYGVTFPSTPAQLSSHTMDKTLFSQLLALKSLYPDKVVWNAHLKTLSGIFDVFLPYIHLEHIGFPENWLEELSFK